MQYLLKWRWTLDMTCYAITCFTTSNTFIIMGCRTENIRNNIISWEEISYTCFATRKVCNMPRVFSNFYLEIRVFVILSQSKIYSQLKIALQKILARTY